MQNNGLYVGRIATAPGHENYAFIGINSVALEDGNPHGLETTEDIFVHQDDCANPLRVGDKLQFMVTNDHTRGDGHYRAMSATQYIEPCELVQEGEQPLPGFNIVAPFGDSNCSNTGLVLSATPAQNRMKNVDPVVVAKAVANEPALGIPRDSSVPENLDVLLQAFLQYLFPSLTPFGTHFRLDVEEEELMQQVAEANESYLALEMSDQMGVLKNEVERFLSLRKAICFMNRENLIRRDTIIPIKYLPDFFTAVPVWFFWTDEPNSPDVDAGDPKNHPSTEYFCKLFPNQNWADFYQMFNRRFRTLRQYKGDIIPPSVLRRIREIKGDFDYLVIMTPYHDVAGRDWSDTEWIRSIDPYVVGFKKNIPYFFILARFSDSGTFPLFNELVGDTMEFLKHHVGDLAGFNAAINPYWHMTDGPRVGSDSTFYNSGPLGNHLQDVAHKILNKFENAELFDWLRGE